MNKTYLPNPQTGVYRYEGIAYLDGQFYRTVRGGNQFQHTYAASEEQHPITQYHAEQLVSELPEDIKQLVKQTEDIPVAHLRTSYLQEMRVDSPQMVRPLRTRANPVLVLKLHGSLTYCKHWSKLYYPLDNSINKIP